MPMFAVTVTTTDRQIANYNPVRKSLVILNNGTDTVFISQDPANIATSGFPLLSGASASFTELEGDEPELRMFAIANSGSQDVRVTEGYGREEVEAV